MGGLGVQILLTDYFCRQHGLHTTSRQAHVEGAHIFMRVIGSLPMSTVSPSQKAR